MDGGGDLREDDLGLRLLEPTQSGDLMEEFAARSELQHQVELGVGLHDLVQSAVHGFETNGRFIHKYEFYLKIIKNPG